MKIDKICKNELEGNKSGVILFFPKTFKSTLIIKLQLQLIEIISSSS